MQSDFWSDAYPVLPFSGEDVGHAALATVLVVVVLVAVLAAVAAAVLRTRRRRLGAAAGAPAVGDPAGRRATPPG